MADRDKASRSRRRLLDTARDALSRAEQLANERGPLLRAAFQLRGTRCGKQNCKCNQGQLHTTAVLVVSEEGKRRSYYIRSPERPEVQRRVERYQRFRAGRIEINRLATEILNACDELLDALAEPHAPQRDADGGDQCRRRRRGTKRT
jgi:hypothetical protein